MKQLRNTRQRQLVLDAALARHDHPSADQIYLDVRRADGRISRGTVYRNLNLLVRNGELMHVKLPGVDRFDYRLEPHYHAICVGCGRVFDVPMDYRRELDTEAEEKLGFAGFRHRLVFEGLCGDCVKNKTRGAREI